MRLGIRKIAGGRSPRAIARAAQLVAVVNEALAKQYWPGQSPIGACVKLGADTVPCTTIVGVVRNTRRQDLVEATPVAQVYRPLVQLSPR